MFLIADKVYGNGSGGVGKKKKDVEQVEGAKREKVPKTEQVRKNLRV